jgi:hypothetical protein
MLETCADPHQAIPMTSGMPKSRAVYVGGSETPALRNAREFWTGGWRDPNATAEYIDLVASNNQARAIPSLHGIPVHLMVAGANVIRTAVAAARRKPIAPPAGD